MPPLLLLFVLLFFSAPALAIYKCEADDKVVYSDTPCRTGKATEITGAAPSSDAKAAQQKLARDKAELRRLEVQRQKREAIAEKERQKLFKANEAKKKKCADLALRVKWANEDAARASMKSAERAKQKTRRLAEKYRLECDAK